ncbi:MAG: hypothetical protein AcusKO_19550 [Acuticoccus sp.]
MNGQRTRRPRNNDEQSQSPPGLRPMHISLRSGERLFLNGAVLRVDRKVTLELLNDATFLLENHVMQVEDTTTPLRQLYFAAQAILMDPQNAKSSQALFDAMAADLKRCLTTPTLIEGLDEVRALMGQERTFQALKALRGLFEEEAAVLRHLASPRLPDERRPGRAAAVATVADKLAPVIPPQGYAAGKAAPAPNRHPPTLQ